MPLKIRADTPTSAYPATAVSSSNTFPEHMIAGRIVPGPVLYDSKPLKIRANSTARTCRINPAPRIPTRARRRIFTLIELLVVIAIISILAALILPVLRSAKATALTNVCKNNIRQVINVSLNYGDDWNGILPHYGTPGDNKAFTELSTDDWYRKLAPYYVRGSKGGTIFHCPQATSSVQPRWNYLDRCDFDFSVNYNIACKKIGANLTMGPYMKHLTSRLSWYFDAKMAPFTDGYYPYPWTFAINAWMIDSTSPFYGQGHPGKSLNIGFGDGHVEPMSRETVIERSGTSGSALDKEFNGWYTAP